MENYITSNSESSESSSYKSMNIELKVKSNNKINKMNQNNKNILYENTLLNKNDNCENVNEENILSFRTIENLNNISKELVLNKSVNKTIDINKTDNNININKPYKLIRKKLNNKLNINNKTNDTSSLNNISSNNESTIELVYPKNTNNNYKSNYNEIYIKKSNLKSNNKMQNLNYIENSNNIINNTLDKFNNYINISKINIDQLKLVIYNINKTLFKISSIQKTIKVLNEKENKLNYVNLIAKQNILMFDYFNYYNELNSIIENSAQEKINNINNINNNNFPYIKNNINSSIVKPLLNAKREEKMIEKKIEKLKNPLYLKKLNSEIEELDAQISFLNNENKKLKYEYNKLEKINSNKYIDNVIDKLKRKNNELNSYKVYNDNLIKRINKNKLLIKNYKEELNKKEEMYNKLHKFKNDINTIKLNNSNNNNKINDIKDKLIYNYYSKLNYNKLLNCSNNSKFKYRSSSYNGKFNKNCNIKSIKETLLSNSNMSAINNKNNISSKSLSKTSKLSELDDVRLYNHKHKLMSLNYIYNNINKNIIHAKNKHKKDVAVYNIKLNEIKNNIKLKQEYLNKLNNNYINNNSLDDKLLSSKEDINQLYQIIYPNTSSEPNLKDNNIDKLNSYNCIDITENLNINDNVCTLSTFNNNIDVKSKDLKAIKEEPIDVSIYNYKPLIQRSKTKYSIKNSNCIMHLKLSSNNNIINNKNSCTNPNSNDKRHKLSITESRYSNSNYDKKNSNINNNTNNINLKIEKVLDEEFHFKSSKRSCNNNSIQEYNIKNAKLSILSNSEFNNRYDKLSIEFKLCKTNKGLKSKSLNYNISINNDLEYKKEYFSCIFKSNYKKSNFYNLKKDSFEFNNKSNINNIEINYLNKSKLSRNKNIISNVINNSSNDISSIINNTVQKESTKYNYSNTNNKDDFFKDIANYEQSKEYVHSNNNLNNNLNNNSYIINNNNNSKKDVLNIYTKNKSNYFKCNSVSYKSNTINLNKLFKSNEIYLLAKCKTYNKKHITILYNKLLNITHNLSCHSENNLHNNINNDNYLLNSNNATNLTNMLDLLDDTINKSRKSNINYMLYLKSKSSIKSYSSLNSKYKLIKKKITNNNSYQYINYDTKDNNDINNNNDNTSSKINESNKSQVFTNIVTTKIQQNKYCKSNKDVKNTNIKTMESIDLENIFI